MKFGRSFLVIFNILARLFGVLCLLVGTVFLISAYALKEHRALDALAAVSIVAMGIAFLSTKDARAENLARVTGMGRVLSTSITSIFAVIQLVAMILFLMVCLGGINGLIGAPTLPAAAGCCAYAVGATICGYGCFRIYKLRVLTISSVVSSIFACAAVWYFWAIFLPSFDG